MRNTPKLMDRRLSADADPVPVTSPTGLNIEGETPAEVDIFLAAQTILHREERSSL